MVYQLLDIYVIWCNGLPKEKKNVRFTRIESVEHFPKESKFIIDLMVGSNLIPALSFVNVIII